MAAGPHILLATKLFALVVELSFPLLGHTSSGGFLHWDNLHQLLSVPAGILGVYCYNIHLGLVNQLMPDREGTLLGPTLLIQLILFDVIKLFCVFLTGESSTEARRMLTCSHSGSGLLACLPSLSPTTASHLLGNIMKAFLATWLGLSILQQSAHAEHPQLSKESQSNPVYLSDELPL